MTWHVHRGEVSAASRLFAKCDSYGLEPTTASYNTLMQGWGKTGDLEMAVGLLDQMYIRDGIPPDGQTFAILVNACAKAGRTDKAFALINRMPEFTLQPCVVVYTSLIECCGNSGDLEKAFAVYKEMLSKGLTPDATCIGALADACKKGQRESG